MVENIEYLVLTWIISNIIPHPQDSTVLTVTELPLMPLWPLPIEQHQMALQSIILSLVPSKYLKWYSNLQYHRQAIVISSKGHDCFFFLFCFVLFCFLRSKLVAAIIPKNREICVNLSSTVDHFDNATFSTDFCNLCVHYLYINGSQLAKMKKSIPDMSLPWNL